MNTFREYHTVFCITVSSLTKHAQTKFRILYTADNEQWPVSERDEDYNRLNSWNVSQRLKCSLLENFDISISDTTVCH